ncbi:sigma-54-dependent transcriptional regulator [Terrihabitans soli]|nr:sigma-54 dependent transcriptional regulator [Terrihabitans soli]
MSGTILIVDDDPVQRRLLEGMARRLGYEAIVLDNGQEALNLLASPGRGGVDVLVLDLVMPELDGFAVMERLNKAQIDIPVIVQTVNGSIDTVISAMRAGAMDFMVKPVGPERFQVSIRNALKTDALASEVRRFRRRAAGTLTFDDLESKSEAMKAALHLGRRAAASNIPVLLEGETGVGKELFARAIAASGDRAGRPFVAVNCGAIPGNLVESVLFGHEKGAFTGATEKHAGKFVEADTGTLFLDEIGELPPEAQVKLLRALQEGEVDPVGGRRPVRVDIRIVSATNSGLIDLVKKGLFREDLYYRLGVFPIGIPPLRNRRSDIRALARGFLARFAAEEGRTIRSISPAALSLLEEHSWPGNVRQLENAVFRAVVLAEGDELTAAEFPQIASQLGMAPSEPVRLPEPQAAPAPAPLPRNALMLTGIQGHVRPFAEIERDTIANALKHYEGQMTEVARRLGIGRSTLYRKLKELDLEGEAGTSTSPGAAA